MIRQYDLIGKTTALTIANIQEGWLPKISVQAQATYQSDVSHGARHAVPPVLSLFLHLATEKRGIPTIGVPPFFFSVGDLQHSYRSVAHTRCHAQRGTNRRQNRNQNLNQRLPCLFLHNFKF